MREPQSLASSICHIKEAGRDFVKRLVWTSSEVSRNTFVGLAGVIYPNSVAVSGIRATWAKARRMATGPWGTSEIVGHNGTSGLARDQRRWPQLPDGNYMGRWVLSQEPSKRKR